MSLTTLRQMLIEAHDLRAGVAALNVISLEHAAAITEGAATAGRPVVLQLSENTIEFHGGALEPIAAACRKLAEAALVPIALHLDHVTSVQRCQIAGDLGFGSVMFDGSGTPYRENVALTAAVTVWAHAHGLIVEAELGRIGGKDGIHAPGARTDPAEARTFVEETGVDALAVAIGTSHAMPGREAVLDLDLLGRLRTQVPVPLVLHGSSGLTDERIVQALDHGITKVNVATQLNQAMTAAVRTVLRDNPSTVDPRSYLRAGREAMAARACALVQLIASPRAGASDIIGDGPFDHPDRGARVECAPPERE